MIKKLIFAILFTMLSFGTFATEDAVADLYHERMVQRYPQINFSAFELVDSNDIPEIIEELRTGSLLDLLYFAKTYDLFSLGWGYQSHPDVYRVSNDSGKVLAYTFSDVISKDGQPKSRRFYQASLRVDGAFFIERISDYDL